MSNIIFQKTADEANYEKACKIVKRLFKLIKMNGGIGVITEKDRRVVSFEFIFDFNNMPISFGNCLTTDELLAKAKLYQDLLTDMLKTEEDMFISCINKARKNPRFKTILQDLAIVAEFVRRHNQNALDAMPSRTIH